MEKMRLQKAMSTLGYCSRRKAEELIALGRVRVNGVLVDTLPFMCSLNDSIEVDGERINQVDQKLYFAFNKPLEVVSTLSDPQKRKTIVDFIPEDLGRLFPVGRLDYLSTGLMLLTNDGELANLITHPSSAPEKEYEVEISGALKGDEISKLAKGVYVIMDGYKASPCVASVIKEEQDRALLQIILHEGKKREIRHMMECLGHKVTALKRVRIGNIKLASLSAGELRSVKREEIEQLRRECYERKERQNSKPR